MKNFTLKALFFLCVLSVSTSFAQKKEKASKQFFNQNLTVDNQKILEETGFVRCLTTEYENSLQELYPNRQSNEEFENWLAPKIQEIKAQRASSPEDTNVIITIPVVVHVIHNGQPVGVAPNITDAQVESQITVMTQDFRRMVGTPGFNTHADGADVEIEFCLAQQDPSGNPTNGINRVNLGQNSFSTAEVNGTVKPTTQWDPTQYMNMWSVNFTDSQLLGYAQFPDASGLAGLDAVGGAANTDGVVAAYSTFGSIDLNDGTFLLNAPFDGGRTMTHEVGHWLGLRHIWGDTTACSNDDFCADTPDATGSNGGCPTVDSCSLDGLGNDMVENYMDYTNDTCMNIYTQDQKTRILAVLANSPRRMELAMSNVCTPSTTPLIHYGSTSPGSIMEGSDCNYQDFVIDINLTLAATAPATATLAASGSATENVDYELMNNSVTFAQGSTTASNAVTLRIYNDGLVENDETVDLAINVNTTGDAIASTAFYSVTITNDDTAIGSTSNQVLFYDGFETYADFDINPVGGWTMLDNDGDSTFTADNTDFANEGYTGTFIVFNPSATTPASGTGWATHSGDKGYYCFNSTGNVSGSPQNDDYIFTPQINLTGTGSEVKFWAKGLTDNYNGGERFQVGVSTTDTNPASFTYVTAGPYVIPTLDWAEYTYDLSAYDGQNIYITVHVVSADEFVFQLDDFSVTSNVSATVQTDVNTASSDNVNLNGTGNAFFTDATSGNIMLDVDNTGGFDYGCTNVSVSRDVATAGADAVMYTFAGVTNYVTAKTFDITTANANTSDNTTVSFYFTEAEIAGWEAVTGNNRTNLYVINEGTDEVKPVSITSFGSDLKLTASLTTGLSGTYVFGTQPALNVTSFELSNAFSIYPNPTTDVLNIKISENNLPDGYKIYNMLGQLINEVEINNTSDLSVNTSEFSNGMYFIKITKDNSSISLPFIKK